MSDAAELAAERQVWESRKVIQAAAFARELSEMRRCGEQYLNGRLIARQLMRADAPPLSVRVRVRAPHVLTPREIEEKRWRNRHYVRRWRIKHRLASKQQLEGERDRLRHLVQSSPTTVPAA